MKSSTRNPHALRKTEGTSALVKEYRHRDDPDLAAYCAASRERNNLTAVSIGLPAVGTRMLNQYGIEWEVKEHVYARTFETADRWRRIREDQPDDLYPVVWPQNLSPRLTSFATAVDRCTTKAFLFLDTTPELRPMAVPWANHLDSISDPGSNLIFLDAARVHETIIAHEIGHGWIQYVDGCEDERVMDDVSDPQRLHQLNFIQSWVIDRKVNDLIRRKGFDMSPIEFDVAASIVALCCNIELGYQPPNRREGLFMAKVLANQLLDEDRSSFRSVIDSRRALSTFRRLGDDLAELSVGFANAVRRHGYDDHDSVRRAIDECLLLAFDYTDNGIDLDKDLIVPNVEEPNFDKFPEWLQGAPPCMKCEIGRIMAREEIPDGSRWQLCAASEATTRLSFELPDGSSVGDWTVNHPFPFAHGSRIDRMIEINRQNRDRFMNQHRPRPSAAGIPNPSGTPPFGGNRHYMAGLGRFLTQARLAELLSGASGYMYGMNNPVTYTDPPESRAGREMDWIAGDRLAGMNDQIGGFPLTMRARITAEMPKCQQKGQPQDPCKRFKGGSACDLACRGNHEHCQDCCDSCCKKHKGTAKTICTDACYLLCDAGDAFWDPKKYKNKKYLPFC